MTSVEGANLEYLKNVVLRYMLCSDARGKEHMLKVKDGNGKQNIVNKSFFDEQFLR
jgi:hypothetical protein